MGKRNHMLQQQHDGELDDAGARELGELGAEDRVRLQAIDDIGAAVRNTFAVESEGVEVWAAVEKRLGEPASDGAPVVDLATRRARKGGLKRLLYVAVPALAAAAAAAVLLLGHHALPTNACDIEMLDVSGASAAVIQVPDHEGAGSGTTTVIWTTPEE